MIKNKQDFLVKIARKEELSDNKVAKIFAEYDDINIKNKSTFFDNIRPYFSRIDQINLSELQSDTSSESDFEDWIHKDLRIEKLRLKSIKGYPDSIKPFGIDFTEEKGEPQSMVILGSNGSGKSSLYDTMEFAYCQQIGEADLREFESNKKGIERFHNFLKHFDYSFEDALGKITTVTGEFDVHRENIPSNVRDKINPNTHFISDYDIITNGQLNYQKGGIDSFHNTIAESLGLNELLTLEKNLRAFKSYTRLKETRRINSLNDRIEAEENLIETNKAEKTKKEKELNSLKRNNKVEDTSNNNEEFLSVYEKLPEKNIKFEYDLNELTTATKNYKSSFKIHSSNIREKDRYNELEFLNKGLDILEHSDDCPFCKNSSLSQEEVHDLVKTRIKKIQESNTSSLKLKTNFKAALNELNHFVQEVERINSLIKRERNLVNKNADFNSLTSIDNKILESLSQIKDSEFYEKASSLEENPNYLKRKEEFLYDFLVSYSDFIKNGLVDHTKNLTNKLKERDSILSSLKQQDEERETSDEKTAREQIILLKKTINDLEKQIKESEKIIENSSKELEKLHDYKSEFEETKDEVEEYFQIFHHALNREIENAFEPIQSIVVNILNNYLERENRDVSLKVSKQPDEIDDETGKILSEIITAKIVSDNSEFTPQPVGKYLNTFHYRLFTTMVGISVAIASRINTKINLPLVLDDIFYASDFMNRATIENFLKSILKAYREFTPNMPLQLILFTHDNLIFDCAINALRKHGNEKTTFARLYELGDGEEKENFINLVYQLPDYLPEKLFQKLFV